MGVSGQPAPDMLAHLVHGGRVTRGTVDKFRAAGQQQGFVDVSGRRRARDQEEYMFAPDDDGEDAEPRAPEPLSTTPLEDAWTRRHPGGARDPDMRLLDGLRARPGFAAASAADRTRSRSRAFHRDVPVIGHRR